jgi:hypothetical protein
MLRKLFGWIAESTPAPYLGSPREVDVDMWTSLPTDILLEIFLCLEPTTVVRCACVCKPWRRAITSNAASLRRRRPHLDRFDPSLLLGIIHMNRNQTWLRRTPDPSPFQSALPSNGSGHYETVDSFIPAASAFAAGAIRGFYTELLCSRDGFILLKARTADRLCLCNPVTRDCTFIHPPASFTNYMYVLLTGHDDLSPSGATNDDLAVRILAVKKTDKFVSSEGTERLTYQIFSTSADGAAGTWGPVKHSVREMEQALWPWIGHRSTEVSRGTVYWLAGPGGHCYITGTLALDVHTGRTWTTELPKQCFGSTGGIGNNDGEEEPILATSGDGRLSLIRSLRGPQIQVWVLMNGVAQWTLQHTISIQVQNLGPCCPDQEIARYFNKLTYLSAFCPKSGCVIGMWLDKVLLIDIQSSSRPPVRCIGDCHASLECCPYEMDCSSTYISKMKRY